MIDGIFYPPINRCGCKECMIIMIAALNKADTKVYCARPQGELFYG